MHFAVVNDGSLQDDALLKPAAAAVAEPANRDQPNLQGADILLDHRLQLANRARSGHHSPTALSH
jgi:hypothetical protein